MESLIYQPPTFQHTASGPITKKPNRMNTVNWNLYPTNYSPNAHWSFWILKQIVFNVFTFIQFVLFFSEFSGLLIQKYYMAFCCRIIKQNAMFLSQLNNSKTIFLSLSLTAKLLFWPARTCIFCWRKFFYSLKLFEKCLSIWNKSVWKVKAQTIEIQSNFGRRPLPSVVVCSCEPVVC